MQYIRGDKVFYHSQLQDYLDGEMVIPVTMELHLTNRCNMNCYYCFFDDRDRKLELDILDAFDCINVLEEIGVKGLIFSGGGEPTVHPDFEDIVLYAGGMFDLALITNGLVDISDIVRRFVWVRYSLDSVNPATFRKIKGVDKFNDVVTNIERAIANKGSTTIGIQMVVTEDNYRQIWDMYDFAEYIRADYFQFRPMENAEYPKEIWNEVNAVRKFSKNLTGPSMLTTENKWEELSGKAKQYRNCPGADFIGAIDCKGDYYICCHHVGKQGCYGNLLTDSIDRVLKNRKAVQTNFDYSKCPIACRGSNLNLALNNFNKLEHVNFL